MNTRHVNLYRAIVDLDLSHDTSNNLYNVSFIHVDECYEQTVTNDVAIYINPITVY